MLFYGCVVSQAARNSVWSLCTKCNFQSSYPNFSTVCLAVNNFLQKKIKIFMDFKIMKIIVCNPLKLVAWLKKIDYIGKVFCKYDPLQLIISHKNPLPLIKG